MEACGRGVPQARRLLGLVVPFAERLGEQSTGVGLPRQLGIAQSLEDLRVGIEPLDRRGQGRASSGRVDVARQLVDGRIVEGRLSVQISAGGEHEQRAPERRVSLGVVERDLLACDEGEDYEVDVVSRRRQAAYSSAMASTSSRIPMPSSISSRVIVSGGQTMITFQCVMR